MDGLALVDDTLLAAAGSIATGGAVRLTPPALPGQKSAPQLAIEKPVIRRIGEHEILLDPPLPGRPFTVSGAGLIPVKDSFIPAAFAFTATQPRGGAVTGTVPAPGRIPGTGNWSHLQARGFDKRREPRFPPHRANSGRDGDLGVACMVYKEQGPHTVSQSSKQNAARPILNSIAAHLFVRDIRISCDFFTGRLGFAVDFVYGDPPFYGQVSRDNARLALRHMDEPVFAGDIREREDLVLASITVASVEGIQNLFLSYLAAGVPFHQTLKEEAWGAKTFIVRDPDGNLILFAGPAS